MAAVLPASSTSCGFISLPEPRGIGVALPFILTKLLARSGIARLFPAVQRLTDGGEFLYLLMPVRVS